MFAAVWPYMRAVLGEPRTEAEVAEALELQKGQAKMWLQRAVKEGLARKLPKPVRFVRVEPDSQTSLFDA